MVRRALSLWLGILIVVHPAMVDGQVRPRAPRTAAYVPASMAPYRETASRLIGAALADRAAWQRLAELTDTAGHRLSGSPQLERAVAWAVERMQADVFVPSQLATDAPSFRLRRSSVTVEELISTVIDRKSVV